VPERGTILRQSAVTIRAGRASLECGHAADVPPDGPRRDGSPGPDEEPRSRPDDEPPPVVHPPATAPPLHAGGEPDPGADRPLRRGRAPDRRRNGKAPDPRLGTRAAATGPRMLRDCVRRACVVERKAAASTGTSAPA